MELYLHSLVCLHGVDRHNFNFQLRWSLSYRMKLVNLLLLLLLLLLFCSHPRPGLLSGLLSLGSSTKVVYTLLNLPTHATRTAHRPCLCQDGNFLRAARAFSLSVQSTLLDIACTTASQIASSLQYFLLVLHVFSSIPYKLYVPSISNPNCTSPSFN